MFVICVGVRVRGAQRVDESVAQWPKEDIRDAYSDHRGQECRNPGRDPDHEQNGERGGKYAEPDDEIGEPRFHVLRLTRWCWDIESGNGSRIRNSRNP
jgi:hypothetical protein